MLAERMLSAELNHHLANVNDGSSPKKVLTPGSELNSGHPV